MTPPQVGTGIQPVSELQDLKSFFIMGLKTLHGEIQAVKSDLQRPRHRSKNKRSRSIASINSDSEDGMTVSPSPDTSPNDAWLGDPSGEKVFIHGYSQHRVRAVEGLSADPTKMALALLDVFFTKEQLGRSLVTNKDGRDLLDPNIIERIR